MISRGFAGRWDSSEFERARETFRRAEYTAGGIRELLGNSPQLQALSSHAQSARLAFTGGAAVEVLTRLFQFGSEEPAVSVARHLRSPSFEEWVDAGVLSLEAGRVRSELEMITPHGELWIAADWPCPLRPHLRPDHVMGVGSSSESLLYLMLRQPVGSLLDLGTGSGVLALAATRHAERVVATDLNPRALELARFNARLNGVSSIEFRQEEFFETKNELFDQVVCNPPYVVSPENRYLFRDGHDDLCSKLLASVLDRVDRGGFAQVLANWPLRSDESPAIRAREWTDPLPGDAVVLAADPLPVSDYARTWVATTEPDPELHETRFREWMNYYEEREIVHVAHGLFTLRRSPIHRQRTQFSYLSAPSRMTPEAAEDLRRSFDLLDFLADTDDVGLLSARLRLAPGARLRQISEPDDGHWKTSSVELYRRRGLQTPVPVNRDVAALLARFTGTRTVGEDFEILTQLAGGTGAAIAAVRQAVERGYLWPADLR